MRRLQVKVIIRSVKVCGHDRNKVRTILLIIISALLDRGYLRDGIGLVRRLELSAQQIFFLHRLRGELGIYAGGTEIEQLFGPKLISSVDNVGRDHEVVVNEVTAVDLTLISCKNVIF